MSRWSSFHGTAGVRLLPLLVCVLAGVLLYASLRAPWECVLDVGTGSDRHLLDNFYQCEQDGGVNFRWMGPHARVWLYGVGGGEKMASMRLHGGHLAHATNPQLFVGTGGQHVVMLEVVAPGWRIYRVLLPPGEVQALDLAAANYHRPAGDTRLLAVPFDWVRVASVGAVPLLSRGAVQRALLLVGVVFGAMGLWYATDRLLWSGVFVGGRWVRVSGVGGAVALVLLVWAQQDRATLAWVVSATGWVCGFSVLAALLPWWLPWLHRVLDGETHPLSRATLATALFWGVGLVLVWQALAWPMVYDDLHLLRRFSWQELADSFVGNWDSDNVETPGLRPFNIIFYHGRYLLFGENVVAHRLAMVGLYALVLTGLCWIAARVGVPWSASVLAGVLSLCAKYSMYHYVWLTDGVHIFQGIAFVVAVLLLLHALERGGLWHYALSLVALAVGILTREDTLAVVPVVVLLAGVVCGQRKWQGGRALLVYTLVLAALCVGLLAYRALVVVNPEPLSVDVRGYLWHVVFMLHPLGIVPFHGAAQAFLVGWWVILALLAVVSGVIWWRARAAWHGSLVWLGAALLACSPGLTLVRVNLLFFVVPFFLLFVVTTLYAIAGGSRVLRLVAAVMVVWVMVGGGYTSLVTAHMFHPDSTSAIAWNCQFLYGAELIGTTIPSERRGAVAERLARAGIRSDEDRKRVLPVLIAEALAAHRRVPGGEGLVFVPYVQRSQQPESRHFFREGVR